MLPTQLTAPSSRPRAAGAAAIASAASHATDSLHGSAAAHAGGRPVRETETTSQLASTSALHTRLPMKPLPP